MGFSSVSRPVVAVMVLYVLWQKKNHTILNVYQMLGTSASKRFHVLIHDTSWYSIMCIFQKLTFLNFPLSQTFGYCYDIRPYKKR